MRSLVAPAALFILVCSLSAQGVSTSGVSLLLPTHAEEASLNGSAVAGSASLGGAATNPASLSGLAAPEIRFTHLEWLADVRTEALLAAVPVSFGTFAAAVTTTSVPGIEIRDIPGPSLGSFTARAVSVRLSGAIPVNDEFAAGVTVKYLYEKLLVNDATGGAIDAGILYHPADFGWSFGASATNLGSLSAFRTAVNDLPASLQIGTSRMFDVLGWNWTLNAAYAYEIHPKQSHLLAGLESWYDATVGVRVGYVSGYDDVRDLAVGVGLRYDVVRIDYAYLPIGLGMRDAQCITIGLSL